MNKKYVSSRKDENIEGCSTSSPACGPRWRNRLGGFMGGFIFGLLILFAYYIKVSPSEFYNASKITLCLILLSCGALGALVGNKIIEKLIAWLSWLA
jgi:hypothetical protein